VQRYRLFTLMVFDHHHQGLLVAWVITSDQTKLDLIQWLLAMKEHTLKEDPTWRPSCFIVDYIPQKHHAIKYNTQFTYLVHFVLCSFVFRFKKKKNNSNLFSHGCGCGCVFLLTGCLCFSILGRIINLLLMDNTYFL
jgi:hypothetical protein